jgi:beta-1,4-mannosyl-glycoprotein beta-1,4-N-acetylglucosaminyltransferase
MIIDCFPLGGFGCELDILEIRLNYLSEITDFFIISEANMTQSRIPKPFYFEQNKDRFAKFLDRIVYVKVEDSVPGGIGNWKQEIWQRQNLLRGMQEIEDIKGIEIKDTSYICLSDLDEIGSPEFIKQQVYDNIPVSSLNHFFNCFYLDLGSICRGWFGTCIIRANLVKQNGFQFFREKKDHLEHVNDTKGSFHLSSMGGFDVLFEQKYKYCIEPYIKDNLEAENKEKLRAEFNKCVLEEKYFFHSDNPQKRETKLDLLDKNMFNCFNDIDKYQHLMFPQNL